MPILFCNIAWMREYKGIFRLDQEPDDIPQRGGEWVNENSTAGECCNFLTSENGYVTYQNMWNGAKAGLRKKFMVVNAKLREKRY